MAHEMTLKRNPKCIHLYFDFIYVVLEEYRILILFYVFSIYTRCFLRLENIVYMVAILLYRLKLYEKNKRVLSDVDALRTSPIQSS